jgi:hypothetical protein
LASFRYGVLVSKADEILEKITKNQSKSWYNVLRRGIIRERKENGRFKRT